MNNDFRIPTKNELREAIDKAHDAEVKALRDELARVNGELAAAVAERDAMRATVAALEKDRDSLSQVVKDEYGKREALDAELAALRDELARVKGENERLQRDMQSIVSGFRSHLGDIIRRIGPARRPDDIRASLEELHNSHNNWADHSAESQLAAAVADRDTMRARYEEAVALLRKFTHHKTYCAGFPASTEEFVAANCDCGKQAAAAFLASLPEPKEQTG